MLLGALAHPDTQSVVHSVYAALERKPRACIALTLLVLSRLVSSTPRAASEGIPTVWVIMAKTVASKRRKKGSGAEAHAKAEAANAFP